MHSNWLKLDLTEHLLLDWLMKYLCTAIKCFVPNVTLVFLDYEDYLQFVFCSKVHLSLRISLIKSKMKTILVELCVGSSKLEKALNDPVVCAMFQIIEKKSFVYK